jgi:Phage tail tube protein FII
VLPKILRNFNVFVDGRGYAGKIDEITLPKLTIKTDEYRAGGMDIPINIDMGMEKLEADFTFSEYVYRTLSAIWVDKWKFSIFDAQRWNAREW